MLCCIPAPHWDAVLVTCCLRLVADLWDSCRIKYAHSSSCRTGSARSDSCRPFLPSRRSCSACVRGQDPRLIYPSCRCWPSSHTWPSVRSKGCPSCQSDVNLSVGSARITKAWLQRSSQTHRHVNAGIAADSNWHQLGRPRSHTSDCEPCSSTTAPTRQPP